MQFRRMIRLQVVKLVNAHNILIMSIMQTLKNDSTDVSILTYVPSVRIHFSFTDLELFFESTQSVNGIIRSDPVYHGTVT